MNNHTWVFPKTNWGTENGKNDPGLETFRGNPYPALAREPIQNSLDARMDPNKPVRVEFTLLNVDSKDFPGRNEYIKVLKQCADYAKDGSDTKKEIESALKEIEKDSIPFMKISDYNTTGLTGSDKLRDSDWHRLIKVVGDSDKEETSGGAFGIGKHAPFVCSNLKAVFYRTKDTNGKSAFQGVAKLITFLDENEEPRQATGFYGEEDRIQPIKNMNIIHNMFVREEVGTDLYVAGFDYKDTWEQEITEAVISSFFVAIHEGSLEVKVGKNLITQSNLSTYIDEMKSSNSSNKVINYYEALTNAEPFIEEDFEGLGKVEFYVLNNKNYHRKVAMVRKTGMLIKEKPNNNTPEKYAGVLLIKGDLFNRELKRVENPTHTDWELKRKKDVSKIRKALKALDTWMNAKIKSISPFSDVTSINVDELSQFLPNGSNELSPVDGDEPAEGVKTIPLKTKLFKKSQVLKQPKKPSKQVSDFTDDNEEDVLQGSGPDKQDGNDSLLNGGGSKGTEKRKTEPSTTGGQGSDKENSVKGRTALVSDHKIFCTNPDEGIYTLNLHVKKPGTLSVNLFIIGEESNEPANVTSAFINESALKCNQDQVGPFYAAQGKKAISFKLDEKLRVAMGVKFNEN